LNFVKIEIGHAHLVTSVPYSYILTMLMAKHCYGNFALIIIPVG